MAHASLLTIRPLRRLLPTIGGNIGFNTNPNTSNIIMKTVNFPYLALALGLLLLLIVIKGSEITSDGTTALPLLTLLIINECAFLLNAVAAFIGIRYLQSIRYNFSLKPLYTMTTILCALLTVQFTLLGIKLWPL